MRSQAWHAYRTTARRRVLNGWHRGFEPVSTPPGPCASRAPSRHGQHTSSLLPNQQGARGALPGTQARAVPQRRTVKGGRAHQAHYSIALYGAAHSSVVKTLAGGQSARKGSWKAPPHRVIASYTGACASIMRSEPAQVATWLKCSCKRTRLQRPQPVDYSSPG